MEGTSATYKSINPFDLCARCYWMTSSSVEQDACLTYYISQQQEANPRSLDVMSDVTTQPGEPYTLHEILIMRFTLSHSLPSMYCFAHPCSICTDLCLDIAYCMLCWSGLAITVPRSYRVLTKHCYNNGHLQPVYWLW